MDITSVKCLVAVYDNSKLLFQLVVQIDPLESVICFFKILIVFISLPQMQSLIVSFTVAI